MKSLQNRRNFCQLHINEINTQKYIFKKKKCKTYISKVPLSHQINQWVNELNIFSKKKNYKWPINICKFVLITGAI